MEFTFGLRCCFLTCEARTKHVLHPTTSKIQLVFDIDVCFLKTAYMAAMMVRRYVLCKMSFSIHNISLFLYCLQEILSWTVTLSLTASLGIFSVATPS